MSKLSCPSLSHACIKLCVCVCACHTLTNKQHHKSKHWVTSRIVGSRSISSGDMHLALYLYIKKGDNVSVYDFISHVLSHSQCTSHHVTSLCSKCIHYAMHRRYARTVPRTQKQQQKMNKQITKTHCRNNNKQMWWKIYVRVYLLRKPHARQLRHPEQRRNTILCSGVFGPPIATKARLAFHKALGRIIRLTASQLQWTGMHFWQQSSNVISQWCWLHSLSANWVDGRVNNEFSLLTGGHNLLANRWYQHE